MSVPSGDQASIGPNKRASRRENTFVRGHAITAGKANGRKRWSPCWRRFVGDRRGGIALITAIALPPIAMISLGAVQIQQVYSIKGSTQDLADAAALWGAKQLQVNPTGADQRTITWTTPQAQQLISGGTATVTATVTGGDTIKVAVDGNIPSFFMNLFPPGGFNVHAEATAQSVNQTPLCVLAVGTSGGDDMVMSNSAKLRAAGCLVHSNQKVAVSGAGLIQGGIVEAVDTASGPTSPTATTGALPIDDPFATMAIDTSACLVGGLIPITVPNGTTMTLNAGLHLANYYVKNSATLRLQPGEHIFCGVIDIKNSGNLSGNDVVLILDKSATFEFKGGADISLNGRESGPYAGFVIVQDRNASGTFDLYADPISNVTGAIYMPKTALRIDGTAAAAGSSAWTVMAAKRLEGINLANLVINRNYSGSPVPVPQGVGNNFGHTRVTH